jgi:hypothetical protein
MQQGDTAVYWAARQGHLEAIRCLHEAGLTLDSQNKVRDVAIIAQMIAPVWSYFPSFVQLSRKWCWSVVVLVVVVLVVVLVLVVVVCSVHSIGDVQCTDKGE